ncbi:hypothetical protein ACFE04_016623 [Oxalis oulophora]
MVLTSPKLLRNASGFGSVGPMETMMLLPWLMGLVCVVMLSFQYTEFIYDTVYNSLLSTGKVSIKQEYGLYTGGPSNVTNVVPHVEEEDSGTFGQNETDDEENDLDPKRNLGSNSTFGTMEEESKSERTESSSEKGDANNSHLTSDDKQNPTFTDGNDKVSLIIRIRKSADESSDEAGDTSPEDSMQTPGVVSIAEMNNLLLQSRTMQNSEKPRWPSPADQELIDAKSQIENAPIVENDPELYAPLYRNVSMFKRSYELMEKTLKVYTYREGRKPIFHVPILKGIYASEGWFMKLLRASNTFVTTDGTKAHLFYLPFSSRMLGETLYVADSHSRWNLEQHLKDYLDTISTRYPFWNRTDGADHFLVACHDWAPAETRKYMRKCIRALCNSDIQEGYNMGKDVSLPETMVRNAQYPLRNLGGMPLSKRKTLAFFAGKMHGYLRPILMKHWGGNTDPDMKFVERVPRSKNNKHYSFIMKTSKYCVCPRGFEVNSPRLVEAIFYECVPVIIADNFVPPFFEILKWKSFAVFVAEKDVPNLKNILLSISDKRYREMQMRVKRKNMNNNNRALMVLAHSLSSATSLHSPPSLVFGVILVLQYFELPYRNKPFLPVLSVANFSGLSFEGSSVKSEAIPNLTFSNGTNTSFAFARSEPLVSEHKPFGEPNASLNPENWEKLPLHLPSEPSAMPLSYLKPNIVIPLHTPSNDNTTSKKSTAFSDSKHAASKLNRDEKHKIVQEKGFKPDKNLSIIRTERVITISEMNDLLVKSRNLPSSLTYRRSSKAERELLLAKSQILNAPIVKNDQKLYAPLYHNFSMFKRSYELMENMLKVYVYKDGKKPIFHQQELKGIYASEGWFMKLMETNKKFVTRDPGKAHLFYLPFSSRMLQVTFYDPIKKNHDYLIQYMKVYEDMIATKYPFWNRTNGTDHFLVACHDWAPAETTGRMNNCIRALCVSDINFNFTIRKDVSLPETNVRTPEKPVKNLGGYPPAKRTTLAFFAGGRTHGYLRPILLKHWENKDPDMKIFGRLPSSKGDTNYIQLMKSSKFCICPRGFKANSPRLVEAIFFECVPVIIADNYVPPLSEVLNWEKFAVFVMEKDIPDLKKILVSISEKKYIEMHKMVKKVQHHFLWHSKAVKYDLFHMILHSVWYNRVFR